MKPAPKKNAPVVVAAAVDLVAVVAVEAVAVVVAAVATVVVIPAIGIDRNSVKIEISQESRAVLGPVRGPVWYAAALSSHPEDRPHPLTQ